MTTSPAVAVADRERRRAGDGRSRHHDRLRHLRRQDRDLRRGRQRHHVRLRRRTASRSRSPTRRTPPPGSSTPVNGTTTTAYNNLGAVDQPDRPARQHHEVRLRPARGRDERDRPGRRGDHLHLRPGRRAALGDRPDRGADPGHLRQPGPHGHHHRPGAAEHLRRLHHDLRVRRRGQPGLADQPDRGRHRAPPTTRWGSETSSTDGAGNTTTYAYNLDGNLVKTTLPDGTATTATYDLAGRETAQAGPERERARSCARSRPPTPPTARPRPRPTTAATPPRSATTRPGC